MNSIIKNKVALFGNADLVDSIVKGLKNERGQIDFNKIEPMNEDSDDIAIDEYTNLCMNVYLRTNAGTEEEAEKLELSGSNEVVLVSQTTFNHNKFNKMVEIFEKKGYNITVYNTICNATEERQKEAASIAKQVDAMIVIGGMNSSNTQKLYDISKKECANTYYIQTLVDLDLAAFESVSRVGITAGASTPNYIIKEVHGSMAEDFGKMFEESLAEESRISAGKIVKGTVIDVKDDEIILNINYKADGIITKSEYSNDVNISLKDKVQVGEEIEAKVIKTNDGDGQVLLSVKRVAAEKANEKLEEAFNNEEVLKGVVTQVLDGGLSVTVEEARVFIPASLVSDTYEKDLTKYKDQEIEFKITEFNPRKRRIIGNRKMLIEAEKKAAADLALATAKAEAQKKLAEAIEAKGKAEAAAEEAKHPLFRRLSGIFGEYAKPRPKRRCLWHFFLYDHFGI